MRVLLLLLCLSTVLLAGRSAASANGEPAGSADTETYHLSKVLDLSFDDTKAAVVAGLTERKFAVLTEIRLHEAFKEKLDKDIPRTEILGACGAKFAAKAYDLDRHLPVLLPCNIVLADLGNGRTEVSIRNPRGLAMANPELTAAGEEVYAVMTDLLASL